MLLAMRTPGLIGLCALAVGCNTSAGSPPSGASSATSGSSSGSSSGSTGGSTGDSTGSASSSSASTSASSSARSSGSASSTSQATSSASTGASSGGSSATGGAVDGGLGDAGFDPGLPGPYAVGSTLDVTHTFAGQSVPFDLFYPTGSDGGAFAPPDGGLPEILVSHGWLDDKSSFSGWGAHLASWGFAVGVPTWTNQMNYFDAAANAASANALLSWMDSEGASDSASPLYGLVDGTRHGLVGHSFGGLMVYVAASENAAVQAVVGLDAVDDPSGTAAAAVATIAGMGAMLPAQPALCNSFGSDQATVYANFPGPKLYAQVANAIHCDCQDPTGPCQTTCGNADPIRQMHFERYATATLLWALECDPRARTWIDGAAIAADTGLSSNMNAKIACGP